ncbi:MAG: DUF1192 domain-containing protein [Rhodospirillales bacterium]|nr:DUF1192 domain-containing protein [Rhodospirillales bacterium]
MFDDDLPKPKTQEFPRNLDNMSIAELAEYIEELKAEIIRVEADKSKKQASQEAAASVFSK